MTPEMFAIHSAPINKTAFFTVYCPNMGYRDDQRIECCEEYENVLFAINSINDELRQLKLDHKKRIKKVESLPIPDTEKRELLNALSETYRDIKAPLVKRFFELTKLKDEIKEKMGIIGRTKEKLSFNSILIHELFRFMTKEQGDIALERTRERCRELKIQY
ncbi:hypothetical protein HYE60_06410 [Aggregatibacter actinomycetemcomitans]|uniref:hypothetical protein n=1 Tax=Aggregatibacter actinomycetemcomitans TaxID=714 RepID=UPI00197B3E86|nr:hypothetical protein [Aggregatibacter actinomycetemcomitans]MBN6074878.1 hypothetical protein [Aggregatibacter actinomycetemcomitans]